MTRLYEFHPNGKEQLLLDTMNKLKQSGFDWERVFSEEFFPKTSAWGLPNPFKAAIVWHGVNVAEALKAGAVAYRFTHNETGTTATLPLLNFFLKQIRQNSAQLVRHGIASSHIMVDLQAFSLQMSISLALKLRGVPNFAWWWSSCSRIVAPKFADKYILAYLANLVPDIIPGL
ncbi:hypothetical protein MPER_08995 [Moniliophthora perniciosa FA553]|nr:hypothetical protein MPER_08995 [Moniliophthora perniciosa FA553]